MEFWILDEDGQAFTGDDDTIAKVYWNVEYGAASGSAVLGNLLEIKWEWEQCTGASQYVTICVPAKCLQSRWPAWCL
jgi:hypothetical protein